MQPPTYSIKAAAAMFIFSGLSACGNPPAKKKNNVLPENFNTDSGFINYSLEDTDCQNSKEHTKLENFQAFQWDGNSTSPTTLSENGIISTTSLSSPAINTTIFGQHQKENCTFSDDKLHCSGNITIEKKATPLKICRGEANYDRESVEGISLTAMHHIDLAWSFYQNIAESTITIAKSTLVVLPKVEQSVTLTRNGEQLTKSHVVSDNLAYVPAYGGQPAFVIYPTSEKNSPSGNNKIPNFWESPWAIAHEFGHHVLRSHTGIKNFSTNELLPGNDAIINIDSHESHLNGGIRKIGIKQHWDAANEGFSDLFAFYSNGSKPQMAKSLPCMEQNRDVTNGHFKNGRAKIIDTQTLSQYNSPTVVPPTNCNEPYFQGPHSVGAIIAYGVNRLYDASRFVKTDNGHPSTLLLRWANNLRRLVNTSDSKTITLQKLIERAVESASVNRALTKEQCTILRESFPTFANSWIGLRPNEGYVCRSD